MTQPKGTIVIIGGAEEKENGKVPEMKGENKNFKNFEILGNLTDVKKEETSIAVITSASGEPEAIGKTYVDTFGDLGYKRTFVLNIRKREETADSKYHKIIEDSNIVFFTGGDQFKLVTIIGRTSLDGLILKRYYEDRNFVIAGTSAGAAAIAKVMIYEGRKAEAMLKGDVKTMSGLGYFDGCIVDTHFIQRGRFSRLAQAIITNPSCVGLGLGEDTALMIKKGNVMECFGSGMVIVIDGKNTKFTNIVEAEEGTPICVENLTVHLMCNGNFFLLDQRHFMPGSVIDRK